MSENVTSFGVMVPLVNPIGNSQTAAWEQMQAKLSETNLHINYEGTIIYSQNSTDGPGIVLSNIMLLSEFSRCINEHKIEVTHEEQFYVCNWYNGTDSDMSEITLQDFLIKSGQEIDPVRAADYVNYRAT